VSLRTPSGFCQVDSASGGSMRRNMWFGRGAAHLLSEGVFFGREQKSHCRRELIVGCVGCFSPWGTASSRFWRRSRTHRQNPHATKSPNPSPWVRASQNRPHSQYDRVEK
jgi:hypothetical protein